MNPMLVKKKNATPKRSKPKLEEGGGKNSIEKALSTKKREEIKAYVYFTHRQPPFAKNTKRTRTVESGI